MSDLGSLSQFAGAVPHLPLRWYFDAEVEGVEWERLFLAGPRYAGHQLLVPEAGDYHSLPWRDHAALLVNNGRGV